MTYLEKLLDPRWQKKRLDVFHRDGFKCRLCSDEETTLHVHHEEYTANDPWDTPIDKLTTLCANCHLVQEYLKKSPFLNLIIVKLDKEKLDKGVVVFAYLKGVNTSCVLIGTIEYMKFRFGTILLEGDIKHMSNVFNEINGR